MRLRLIGIVDLAPNHAGPLARGPRELLAYLALHGSATRERIAAALWPEAEGELALYYLRRALTALRKHLGSEAVRLDTTDRRVVRLDTVGLEVDLHQIREAAAAGQYETLVPLCGGVPLEGIVGDWAASLRKAIRVELTQALTVAARLSSSSNDISEADRYLRAALGHTAESTNVWQELIRLHADAGDLRTARKILAECESTITASDARNPSPLVENGEGRLIGPPAALGELIGRQDVLAQIAGDLEAFRLVTLCGVGGLGKTRTAIEAARRLAHAYPDGVAFVELAPTTGRASIRQAIARALGIDSERGTPWSQALEWLGRRRVLIVLDNAEHVTAEVASAVVELLDRSSRARLLVTSRVPLGLPTERRRRLPPLKRDDTLALFAARASAASPDFRWTAESETLCDQLDGIPLAVELTAAQLGSISLNELSASLTRSLTLDSHGDARPERHQTMRAALQASFDAFPEESRARLIELSVFAGGFSAHAAHGVASVSPPELSRWTTASLVEFDGTRYRMLEPVRQLAAERLAAAGREPAVRSAHARWFAESARNAFPGLFPYDVDPQAYATDRKGWLRDEANLRTAIVWLEENGLGMSDDAQSIWLIPVWYRLIDHSSPSAQAWLPRLEDTPVSEVATPTAARWWLTVALYSSWNDWEERANALVNRLAERCTEAGWLDIYAHLAAKLGHLEIKDPVDGTKRQGYEVAIRLWETLGNKEQARCARVERAAALPLAQRTGDYWADLESLAVESARHGELRTQAMALRLLAGNQTAFESRRDILENVLALQRKVGHWGEVHTLRSIGMAAREVGTPVDEIAAWKEAIRRGDEIGYRGTLAEAHLELARAYFRAATLREAWASMATALRLIRSQERSGFLHLAIAHTADHVRRLGDGQTASEMIQYLRWATQNGIFELRPKYEEIHPGIGRDEKAAPSAIFPSSDEVIEWVELQAILSRPTPIAANEAFAG